MIAFGKRSAAANGWCVLGKRSAAANGLLVLGQLPSPPLSLPTIVNPTALLQFDGCDLSWDISPAPWPETFSGIFVFYKWLDAAAPVWEYTTSGNALTYLPDGEDGVTRHFDCYVAAVSVTETGVITEGQPSPILHITRTRPVNVWPTGAIFDIAGAGWTITDGRIPW